MKWIGITGSTGLLGTALREAIAFRGDAIVRLVRPGSENVLPPRFSYIKNILWDPAAAQPVAEPASLEGLDAVVHLAGDNLLDGRWRGAKKRSIAESRSGSARALATLLARLERKPRVLISASAIGIYGDCGDESVTEMHEPGRGFLPEVVKAWEAATEPAEAAGIRVVHARFGVVLSRSGGALHEVAPLFRLGLGGRLGSGRQWMSWISVRDAVGAIEFLMDDEALSGAVNVVAPQPVRNNEFTRALADKVNRPAVLAVPKFVLRAVFGEMAEATMLASARVIPERLLADDFRFRHARIEAALRSML